MDVDACNTTIEMKVLLELSTDRSKYPRSYKIISEQFDPSAPTVHECRAMVPIPQRHSKQVPFQEWKYANRYYIKAIADFISARLHDEQFVMAIDVNFMDKLAGFVYQHSSNSMYSYTFFK